MFAIVVMYTHIIMSRWKITGIMVVVTAILFFSAEKERVVQPKSSSEVATTVYRVDQEVSNVTYRVVTVVDGDTIKIIRNGTTTTVRLIGVDTPETVDPRKPQQCFGKEASTETKRLISESGWEVRVVDDATQGEYDKYGRLLAYVYLHNGTLLDEYLVAKGYGREYTFKNSTYQFQKQFRRAQVNARAASLGLWSTQTCAGGR